MAKTTISRKNVKCPAPLWFIRLKKAVSRLSNTAVIILLASGYGEESLMILWIRVGISGVLDAIEMLLSDTEENEVSV